MRKIIDIRKKGDCPFYRLYVEAGADANEVDVCVLKKKKAICDFRNCPLPEAPGGGEEEP